VICGTYPCCDEPLFMACPEKTPAFRRDECPKCGTTCWHKLSCIDPVSWTEKDFLERFDINEEKRLIALKPGKKETSG